MLTRDEFAAAATKIASLDTRRHAQLLYGLVRWLQPEVCVEVGAFHGGTAVWIARALQENALDGLPGSLLLIDDFSLQPESECRLWYNLGLLDVGDVTMLARGKSSEVEWPDRVDFAHIDGDHTYDGCRYDVERAIGQGAQCLAVHDVNHWWGPRQWYGEFRERRDWQMIASPHDAGLAVALKSRLWPAPINSEGEYPKGAYLREVG